MLSIMKRLLVTGGAGFIGSHLVDRLLGAGCQVTTIDNFDPFYAREVKTRNIADQTLHPHFRLVEADLRESDSLRRLLSGHFDGIIHLAAKAGVRPSINDPRTYNDVNVNGTLNLLEFAKQMGIPRVVFASSSSVYGVNPKVPFHEDDPVLSPISPYAATKVAAELLGHVYSQLYGITFLALRFFTVYGPRQRPDLAIHKLFKLILQEKPIPIYGDGSSSRDYTYIDDIVTGICSAIEYKGSSYEVINLGNSEPISLLAMVEAIEGALGKKAYLDYQPPQIGDVPRTWASIDKARALLNYQPTTPFLTGISRFAAWIQKDDGFEPVPRS